MTPTTPTALSDEETLKLWGDCVGDPTPPWPLEACDVLLFAKEVAAEVTRRASIAPAAAPVAQEPPIRLLPSQPLPPSNVVPGKVHCAKCGFTLVRTNLYVNSGTTGPGGEETEPCPNDGNPLLPITWEQEAREAWKTCEQLFDRAVAAEKALATPPSAPVAPTGVAGWAPSKEKRDAI